jgi:chromosome segregation ATPase
MTRIVSTKREDVERRVQYLDGFALGTTLYAHRDRVNAKEAAATLRALIDERDALMAIRDEERAALNNALDLRDRHIEGLAARLDRAESERDAAQAEVARLREALVKIRSETGRARGDQAHRDTARAAFSISAKALAGGSGDE